MNVERVTSTPAASSAAIASSILGCSVREVNALMANLRRERLVGRDARHLIVDRRRLQPKYDTGVRAQHANL